MTQLLEKDLPVALSHQLRDVIISRIDQGRYKPGRKLDSIRTLASELGVSTLVVNQALDLLEQEEVIVRIAARGVYVAENYQAGGGRARVVLAFSESAISLDLMAPENWSVVSEMYRGLTAGSLENQAQVRMEHFAPHAGPIERAQQVRRLSEDHVVVFVAQELAELSQACSQKQAVIQIDSRHVTLDPRKAWTIDYDHHGAVNILVDHVVRQGYKRPAVLTFAVTSPLSHANFEARAQVYCEAMAQQGRPVVEGGRGQVDIGRKVESQLTKFLKNCAPDFVFCNHAQYVTAVYEAAGQLGLKIGSDLGVACIASGVTFRGLTPSCTFVRPPSFAMGKLAAQIAGEIRQQGTACEPVRHLLQAELLAGHSTRR